MKLTQAQIQEFQETLWDYYAKHARDLSWRRTSDPYKILVSEIMLQQTQVTRVLPKYDFFLEQFPDVKALAAANLGDVLTAWSGLGYNRRAKYLWQAAQEIMQGHKGEFPKKLNALTTLPGIGKNTAGALLAYVYNEPVLFVETNVRSVYIHHFFADRSDVSDKEILLLLEQTLDRENPREFYWALMDYGSHLKKKQGNNIIKSKHYAKQSKFHGSKRQIRGQVIRLLTEKERAGSELAELITDKRLTVVLDELQKEGLVIHSHGVYRLG